MVIAAAVRRGRSYIPPRTPFELSAGVGEDELMERYS
jgi:hypothetical protein